MLKDLFSTENENVQTPAQIHIRKHFLQPF